MAAINSLLTRSTFLLIVDGNWAQWGNWSTCSATCGHGKVYRRRTCDSPAPTNGGKPCAGLGHESAECRMTSCPGMLENSSRIEYLFLCSRNGWVYSAVIWSNKWKQKLEYWHRVIVRAHNFWCLKNMRRLSEINPSRPCERIVSDHCRIFPKFTK